MESALGWPAAAAVVVASVVAMEGVAWAMHRWLMHGPGWRWHRTHHRPPGEAASRVELNDLFGLIFAGAAIGLCVWGGATRGLAWWTGIGISVYGLLYLFVHEGLAHGRIPVGRVPKRGYLKRLVQAHRLHHAVHTREGAVAFGFLWTPSPAALRRRLQESGALRRTQAGPAAHGIRAGAGSPDRAAAEHDARVH